MAGKIAPQRSAVIGNALPEIGDFLKHFRLFFFGGAIGLTIRQKTAPLIQMNQDTADLKRFDFFRDCTPTKFVWIHLVQFRLCNGITRVKASLYKCFTESPLTSRSTHDLPTHSAGNA